MLNTSLKMWTYPSHTLLYFMEIQSPNIFHHAKKEGDFVKSDAYYIVIFNLGNVRQV